MSALLRLNFEYCFELKVWKIEGDFGIRISRISPEKSFLAEIEQFGPNLKSENGEMCSERHMCERM